MLEIFSEVKMFSSVSLIL